MKVGCLSVQLHFLDVHSLEYHEELNRLFNNSSLPSLYVNYHLYVEY